MHRKGRKFRARFLVGLVGLCIVGILLPMIGNQDIQGHSLIMLNFKRAEIANHELNENILRLKTFDLQSYDPLVADLALLKRNCVEMETLPQYRALQDGRGKIALDEYCAGLAQKSILIDTFKAEHSVLRNSLSYLPLVVAQFKGKANELVSQKLLTGVLLNNLAPEESLEVKLQSEIDKFAVGAHVSKNADLEESFKIHAHSILEHSIRRRQSELQIQDLHLVELLEKLELEYMEVYQVKQGRALLYQFALMLFSLVLLAWLLWVFRRLNEARANLEHKVALRTQELSGAMKQLEDNQQLLVHSAKMTALGEMAGGIAHEINTPLAAIALNAGDLLERLETPNTDITRKRLEAILDIVERVSKIIMGLRRVSRSQSSSRVNASIYEIVEDTLSLCSEKMKAHAIDIRIQVPTDLYLECTPEHISQVLLNFLNNAFDALKESVAESDRWIQIEASGGNDHGLELSVTDAGKGLSEAVQAKLMQPFFTTKAPGVGTGLGLSISKNIVEQHGGKLIYDRGCPNTRFVMKFMGQSAA